jgi:hypothetical protein
MGDHPWLLQLALCDLLRAVQIEIPRRPYWAMIPRPCARIGPRGYDEDPKSSPQLGTASAVT